MGSVLVEGGPYDLPIVGGGINGAGIACDGGLRPILARQG